MKYICVPEGYEKDGQQKTRWNRIGVLFDAQNGKQYVKLYTMPNILLSVFEDDKAKQAQAIPKAQSPKHDEFGADMDVPF